MKRLNEKLFKNFEIEDSSYINGGDGKTRYKKPNGASGSDCYSDDDGSGNLSSGDGVLLDTGQWITMA